MLNRGLVIEVSPPAEYPNAFDQAIAYFDSAGLIAALEPGDLSDRPVCARAGLDQGGGR